MPGFSSLDLVMPAEMPDVYIILSLSLSIHMYTYVPIIDHTYTEDATSHVFRIALARMLFVPAYLMILELDLALNPRN